MGKFLKRGLGLLLALTSIDTLMALPSYTLHPKDKEDIKRMPIVLRAERGRYEEANKKIFAHGHVQVLQGTKRLETESLIFDQKNNTLCLPTDLRFEDGQEGVLTARCGWVNTKFSRGQFKQVRIQTALGQRLTAQTLSKTCADEHILDSVSYTPCKTLCADELSGQSKPPTWALHAQTLHHNSEKKEIVYRDVTFSFLGRHLVTVPFLRLPTHRRSGFLLPYLSRHNVLGMYVGVPYYWAPSKAYDLTFMPVVSTSQGVLLTQVYRHQFQRSFLKIKGGLKMPSSKSRVQGCLHGKFEWHMNRYWRFRADQWWVSHKTFLSTHPFFGQTNAPYLESKFDLEGVTRWTYFRARTMDYKGLQEQDFQKNLPRIYPELTAIYYGPFVGKSFLEVKGQFLYLHRPRGVGMKRGVLDITWTLPWIHSKGAHGIVFGRIVQRLSHQQRQLHGAIMPQVGMDVKWPLRTKGWIVTPQAQVLLAPHHRRAHSWSNEDSQGSLLNLIGLFSKTRHAGYDRFDDSSRLNYALSLSRFFSRGYNLHLMAGQSFSFTHLQTSLQALGAHKGFSDIFGLFQMNFSPDHVFLYRCQIDRKKLDFVQHMVLVRVPLGPFWIKGHYISSKKKIPELPFARCHQVGLHLEYKIGACWTLLSNIVQDLGNPTLKKKTLEVGGGLRYNDDCFSFSLEFQKVNYRLKDIRPGYKIYVSLFLKTIGGVQTRKEGHRDFG